jgi:hypothetical protein
MPYRGDLTMSDNFSVQGIDGSSENASLLKMLEQMMAQGTNGQETMPPPPPPFTQQDQA